MDWDAKGAAGRMNGKEEYFQETACVCIICLGFLDSFGFYSRLALIQSSLSYFVSDWRVTLHGRVNLAYQQNENIPLVFAEQCAAEVAEKAQLPFPVAKTGARAPKLKCSEFSGQALIVPATVWKSSPEPGPICQPLGSVFFLIYIAVTHITNTEKLYSLTLWIRSWQNKCFVLKQYSCRF